MGGDEIEKETPPRGRMQIQFSVRLIKAITATLHTNFMVGHNV